LFAVEVLSREDLEPHPDFLANVEWFIRNRPDLVGHACYSLDGSRWVLSIANANQLNRMLHRLADSDEFLSPFGIRSLSKFHKEHPFCFQGKCVGYEPGESDEKIKGGNSNWRGPIWFPTSYLLIRSLVKFDRALSMNLSAAAAGNGENIVPHDLACNIADRMISIFKRDENGRRPCFGIYEKFQQDPHWRDCLLFNEYYHGETGQGLGASHQTGWTGLVANLIEEWRR